MAQALVVEGVKDNPSCMVCCITGPFYRFLAIIPGMTSEISLGDLALRGSAERNPHMLQFINRPWGVLDHDLHSILIAEVVTPFHGIKEMPFPVIFLFIANGCGNPSLSCARVRTRRQDLGNHSHIGLASTDNSRSKPGQACSHNDNIVLENHAEPISY